MIIFIYGPDTFRSRKKLNEIIQEYKKVHKSGLSLRFFDCEEKKTAVGDARDQVRQVSIFKEKRLNIIINLFSDVSQKEKFQEEIKEFSNSDDIFVVFEDKEIKKTDTLFKALIKNSKAQEFKKLAGGQVRSWVVKEAGVVNLKIEGSSLDLFLDYTGDDLWRISNEMQKLASFKNGKPVVAADVKSLVRPRIENDIFQTIDAIAQKNKKRALDLIYHHIDNGDSPLYLLSMISYQIRNLLVIKELIEKHKPYDLIVKESGLHPFVVKKSYYQANQFPFADLKKIYQRIFEVDLNIKTGKVEPEMALDLLVAAM